MGAGGYSHRTSAVLLLRASHSVDPRACTSGIENPTRICQSVAVRQPSDGQSGTARRLRLEPSPSVPYLGNRNRSAVLRMPLVCRIEGEAERLVAPIPVGLWVTSTVKLKSQPRMSYPQRNFGHLLDGRESLESSYPVYFERFCDKP